MVFYETKCEAIYKENKITKTNNKLNIKFLLFFHRPYLHCILGLSCLWTMRLAVQKGGNIIILQKKNGHEIKKAINTSCLHEERHSEWTKYHTLSCLVACFMHVVQWFCFGLQPWINQMQRSVEVVYAAEAAWNISDLHIYSGRY